MKNRIRILLSFVLAAFAIFVVLGCHKNAEVVEEPSATIATVKTEEVKAKRDIKTARLSMEEQRAIEKEEYCKKNDLVILEDGSVLYLTLDDIKANINNWYTDEEIDKVALMVRGENGDYSSETIWSAHVWTVLNRLGKKGFTGSDSILGIIYSGAFDAVTRCPENMEKPVREDIREIVVDVFARKVYEDMGAPEEKVGRTLPEEFTFFRNEELSDVRNHFYDDWRKGANEYDPFNAPYNPYIT